MVTRRLNIAREFVASKEFGLDTHVLFQTQRLNRNENKAFSLGYAFFAPIIPLCKLQKVKAMR